MDRNIYTTRIGITYIFAYILIISGCQPKNPRYGVEFNNVREKVGLPPLKNNWEYVRTIGAKGCTWINPKRKLKPPYHLSKTILYNKDTILTESDKYAGVKEYQTIDGKFREMLYITYHFVNNQDGSKGWEYTVRKPEETDGGERYYNKRFTISKEKAYSLLDEWNIKRSEPKVDKWNIKRSEPKY